MTQWQRAWLITKMSGVRFPLPLPIFVKVFTDYSDKSAHLLRVWVRSWSTRGWEPRLIFQKSTNPGRSPKVSSRVINFSLRPCNRFQNAVKHGTREWKKAPLVEFPPGVTEDFILNCGRAL